MTARWEKSTALRAIGLAAAFALLVGSLAPWQTTFIVDFSGVEHDGVYTAGIAVGAGLILLVKPEGSHWLALAGSGGVLGAIIGTANVVAVLDSTQQIFGREVQLISPGWGLWVSTGASAVLACAAGILWINPPRPPDP
jgi:hypothetical protein